MLSSRRAEEEEDQRDIFTKVFGLVVLCIVFCRLKKDEVNSSGWACGGGWWWGG